METMFRGFYTVASGMLAQQRRTEMLTNNMSNASTPGFKADQSSLRAFPEMLLKRYEKQHIPTEQGLNFPTNKTVGRLNTGVYAQEVIPSFQQGDLRETNLSTDIALIDMQMPQNEENGMVGSVFFTVENADGDIRYTRNGNFTVDQDGFLTTGSGLYVMDDNGNRINVATDQFTLSENGFITAENGTTARLGIIFARDPYRLVKEGDGLYRAEAGAELVNAYNENGVYFSTQQGFLERSTVDISRTMTDLLSAYRAFEANQKVLQAYDRSMEKAANEIGRIN